jgi:cytochrome b561
MKLRDNKDRYGAVSRHILWLGAVAILVLLSIGLYFHEMSSGEERLYWLRLYMALVFAPLTFRVSWRFVSHAPATLQRAPGQQWATRTVHALGVLKHTPLKHEALRGRMYRRGPVI